MFEESPVTGDLPREARERAAGLHVMAAGFRFLAEYDLMPRPEEAEFARKLARQVESDVNRLAEQAERRM